VAQSTASGLYYIITQEGTGDHPTLQSTVKVRYKGYRLNGDVFDQTSGTSTATFPLTQLILGWQEGIPLLKKGGKGTFFCPSDLAYGSQQVGDIPPNSVLIFEIELVDF
jgi:FKBP-type peptidyl-prolyl cis-trans isomerase